MRLSASADAPTETVPAQPLVTVVENLGWAAMMVAALHAGLPVDGRVYLIEGGTNLVARSEADGSMVGPSR